MLPFGKLPQKENQAKYGACLFAIFPSRVLDLNWFLSNERKQIFYEFGNFDISHSIMTGMGSPTAKCILVV